MLDEKPNLTAIITSRICHDLISPIGAISNGLELLELSGVPVTPEITLITESAKNACAKIRFLRLAFGNTDNETSISNTEVMNILTHYYSDPRTRVNWAIQTDLSSSDLQLLFLLLLCAEKIAPYSAEFKVTKNDTGYEIGIISQSLKTDGFLDFNTHNLIPQDGPSLVQFTMAQEQLNQRGYKLELAETDGDVSITILT